jgi:TolA-binding protein
VLLVPGVTGWAQLPASDAINRGVEAARKGDTNKALEEVFNLLLQQQTSIDLLMRRSQDQQKLIDQQKDLIEKQNGELEQQRTRIQAQQDQLSQSPRLPEGFADNYSADRQYEIAYDLQHIAIFDVRRKDQAPYLLKAIEEYRKVIEKYPTAQKAPDAQYRIAKLYHRYLKDYAQAVKEYEALVQAYPDSQFAELARQALGELR